MNFTIWAENAPFKWQRPFNTTRHEKPLLSCRLWDPRSIQPIVICPWPPQLPQVMKTPWTSDTRPGDPAAGTDLKVHFLMMRVRGTSRCHASFQGTEATNSLIKLWYLWTTAVTNVKSCCSNGTHSNACLSGLKICYATGKLCLILETTAQDYWSLSNVTTWTQAGGGQPWSVY